ncbi:hypothetical protein [Roseimaritima sediminicola]|uniref:hypothetical protein n=1 Tax=Roseimaritima sediminicola TaxID=2662066 RepID=UPI0012983BF1|nr:hypothetical protein [Roseimaritima sediminicola]
MQTTTLIQTNHGVSYPLVGVSRVEQSELGEDEVPPASGAGSDPSGAPATESQHRASQFQYARPRRAASPAPVDRAVAG